MEVLANTAMALTAIQTYQISTLYTLNLHDVLCQIYLNF